MHGIFSGAVSAMKLAAILGWNDVQQTYRRSKVGPFWITIGTGVGIATITLVYGSIFKADLSYFLPYISISMLSWTFMATTITESTQAYVMAESLIKQIRLPLTVHNLRVIFRNSFIAAHNLAVLPVVYLIAGLAPSQTFFLFPLSLIILILNLSWVGVLVSIASTRFRDLGPTISNLLQVAFFLTPVIWLASSLPEKTAHYLLGFNPLYHWLQVMRLPLLNEIPSMENYLISLSTAIIGWFITFPIYKAVSRRVVLWI